MSSVIRRVLGTRDCANGVDLSAPNGVPNGVHSDHAPPPIRSVERRAEPPVSLVDLLDNELSPAALGRLVDGGAAIDFDDDLWERALRGPLREFLARPGKRFRARLTVAAWNL
ncbi:MAG: hypothetical protein ACRDD1_06180, partial [Planctomycetia bacterium]